MPASAQRCLLGLDLQELTTFVEEAGEPVYRARQLFQAIYRDRVSSPDRMSTLPKGFRFNFRNLGIAVGWPEIEAKFISRDGTARYLLKLSDGEAVETVWMPEGDEGEAGDGSEAGREIESGGQAGWKRATICVSSQVGCAVNCQFCLTASLGMKRNLTVGEIVGQVLAVLDDQRVAQPQERMNLVFMGMGEPFLNFENLMKAVRLLVEGVAIPEPRMTVSTAGIAPRISDLGNESIRPKLAISLTAPNNDLRNTLMPINRKWNLEQLMKAARDFPLRNREKITFEYVLLSSVNDSRQHAVELAELIRGIRAKVNLIALNPGPGIRFQTPDERAVREFQETLMSVGIPAFIRKPRGRDIYAACGQLKRTVAIPT